MKLSVQGQLRVEIESIIGNAAFMTLVLTDDVGADLLRLGPFQVEGGGSIALDGIWLEVSANAAGLTGTFVKQPVAPPTVTPSCPPSQQPE